MAKLSELAGLLSDLNTKVEKVRIEVQALKDALEADDVDLPPEAQAALDNLTAALQAVDDINPDV